MSNSIITNVDSLKDFQSLVTTQNPGAVVIKFGAEWCGPCKKIEGLVHNCMEQMPANIQCVVLDVDESFEVYAFFKNKRLINGIPAMFAYYAGNQGYVPDDVVVGADNSQILQFFNKVVQKTRQISSDF